jgi:hypothetical protein
VDQITTRTTDPGSPEAALRFARELGRRLTERNFVDEYVARRCRTDPKIVRDWVSGAAVPSHAEWWYLCRISRDFEELKELWQAAKNTLESAEDAPGPRTPRDPDTTIPAGDPPAGPLARPRGSPREEALEGLVPVGPSDHAERSRHSLTPSPGGCIAIDRRTHPRATDQTILIPDGFVVFRCRISRSRVLEIPLPVELDRRDVERICAFLRTQADPDE